MVLFCEHPDIILIISGSESRKDITKNYLYGNDSLESKYQLLMNGREQVRMENLKIPKAFIDYSRKIDNVYENLEY